VADPAYVDCTAEGCEGGQMECLCDRSCCSGYERCDHCWGNMLVCPKCKYHHCECK
jgi:hypothetical protein